MKNFRMVIKNDSDLATITAGAGTTLASTLPITNMQKYNNSRVARFTSADESIINGNFPSTKIIDSVILWRNTLSSQATWQVIFYDDVDQTGEILFDSEEKYAIPSKALNELDWGVDPLGASVFDGIGRRYSVLWFSAVRAKSFRIILKDESQDFFDVARLYIGKYFETRINASYGMGNSWVDETKQTRTAGASLWSDVVEKYRKINFDIKNLDNDDRVRAFESFRVASKANDFFVSMFPETGGAKERDYSFAGKFTNNPDFTHDFYNNFSAPFEISEA